MSKMNLEMDQGGTFIVSVLLNDQDGNPLNTSGMAAQAQMRPYYDSNTYVAMSVGLANGVISLSLTANQTANIAANTWVYDVVLADTSNNFIRIFEGNINVKPRTTRWLP